MLGAKRKQRDNKVIRMFKDKGSHVERVTISVKKLNIVQGSFQKFLSRGKGIRKKERCFEQCFCIGNGPYF